MINPFEKKKKILILDDEQCILKILMFVLKDEYDLVIKNNGSEAITWLDNGNNIPDLIISDIEMPFINGVEFINRLKLSNFYKEIPIIVISGSDSLENIQNKIPYSIESLFLKPFNPKILKEKINALLV